MQKRSGSHNSITHNSRIIQRCECSPLKGVGSATTRISCAKWRPRRFRFITNMHHAPHRKEKPCSSVACCELNLKSASRQWRKVILLPLCEMRVGGVWLRFGSESSIFYPGGARSDCINAIWFSNNKNDWKSVEKLAGRLMDEVWPFLV